MVRVIPAHIGAGPAATSAAPVGAYLEACEALRDELLEHGVDVPRPILDAIASHRQVYELDPGWLEIEAITELGAKLQALDEPKPEPEPEEESQLDAGDKNGADGLLKVIRPRIVELFHTPDQEPYAAVRVNGIRHIYAVRSRRFRVWLSHAAYRARDRGASRYVVDDLVETFAAEAQFDGAMHQVFNRVAELDGVAYIDLGDDERRAVMIVDGSWRVVDEPPVRFRRPDTAQALPMPERGGSIDLLWKHLNVDEAARPVVLAWLLSALSPSGPYPLLALKGEQGTAKSTAAKFLKRLTDPSDVPLRFLPPSAEALATAASHAHVLVFDNVSRISVAMSDAMCRLSTGGGYAKRKLYTDNDELALEALAPVILTSITDVITRPDLADRSYNVCCAYIEPANRRTERDVDAEFEAEAPRIFGAVLDALAVARDRMHTVTLTNLPRLADAARLAVAAETTLGLNPGSMEQALVSNGVDLDIVQLESVPFGRALVKLSEMGDLDVTASELLGKLYAHASDDERSDSDWPRSAKKVGQDLERIKPVLRRLNIEVSRHRTAGANSQRKIRIRRTDRGASSGS